MPPRRRAESNGSAVPETTPKVLEGVIEPKVAVLSREDARRLTKEINGRTIQLWLLVERAHYGRAWEALGYDSWKAYVSKELDMSESRSFQLLDQAKVMRELAAAGVNTEEMPPPPARIVQVVKNNLPEMREAAAKALSEGANLGEAIRSFAATIQPDVAPRPKGRPPVKDTVLCPCCMGTGRLKTADANALRRALGV